LEAEIIKSKTETPLVPSAPLVMNQNVPGSKLGCRRRVARQ
jgi:CRISPR/Cas system-associated exonuclease Cas4 (RecB family)